jgi:alkanesulfonate monooxygenase SsuD/methylene tetrahydromethanopterin reductase-like flavin-dependent oxidoreductase (luciferase family)
VTDHVIVPPEHAPIYGTIAEALVSLGFLAGRTRRLQLGVSALVVPQRNPLVALKQLTTLDFLSGGRIVTAVAAGWMEGEFALLGADFERRGRVLNEWLELAASAFEQMPGRIAELDGWLAPALVRPGGPELWVAGVSRATLRRAALTGVWHPVALPPEELRTMAVELRERRPDSRVVLRIGVYVQDEPASGADERGRHAIAGPPDWVAERLRVRRRGVRRLRRQPRLRPPGRRGAHRRIRCGGRPATPTLVAPELHRVHGHAHAIGQGERMPGMLTEAQLKRLTAARGTGFDRRFLESMIYHHVGAVRMVEQLRAGDAGAEPEIDAFARHVDSDQRIEIARMRGLLLALQAGDKRRKSSH